MRPLLREKLGGTAIAMPMNTLYEERISSRYLPGPERELGQETPLLPYSTLPLGGAEGKGKCKMEKQKGKSVTQTYC